MRLTILKRENPLIRPTAQGEFEDANLQIWIMKDKNNSQILPYYKYKRYLWGVNAVLNVHYGEIVLLDMFLHRIVKR